MIFYHIMMQKYGSQVFRDLKLDRCTDYLQNTLCGFFWEDFLMKKCHLFETATGGSHSFDTLQEFFQMSTKGVGV